MFLLALCIKALVYTHVDVISQYLHIQHASVLPTRRGLIFMAFGRDISSLPGRCTDFLILCPWQKVFQSPQS